MEIKKLIEYAEKAKSKAYTPHSDFKVGSALLTKTGEVFLGCNIENASYSVTICAERSAMFKAISEGHTKFDKLVMVSDAKETSFPCGSCLQVMNEFCDENFELIIANSKPHEIFLLKELLPHPFNLKNKK